MHTTAAGACSTGMAATTAGWRPTWRRM
jgi:hypothetical protein